MGVSANMHGIKTVTAFKREIAEWAEFKNSAGDSFAIFMPFEVATALETAFNAAMEAARTKQVAA